jgi:hypothetical protein
MHLNPSVHGIHNDGACSGNAKSRFFSENTTEQKGRMSFHFKRSARLSGVDSWHLTLVAITILVAVEVALPVPARAQSFPAPMPAPIGHRQPRAQDLPPDVLRDEGMQRRTAHEPQAPTLPANGSHNTGNAQAGRSKLDQSLQICRGC